jgi:hypothetical protein
MAKLAFWIARLSPLYVIAGLVMGMLGVPGWLVLLPIFLIGAPAGAYLAQWRCPHCGSRVYTVENFKKVKSGTTDFVPGRSSSCPVCGEPI